MTVKVTTSSGTVTQHVAVTPAGRLTLTVDLGSKGGGTATVAIAK
jgi:hypothetical protein